MSSLFGPVPSRRLGKSLGIDCVPYKTCSFNCIYCELGPTNICTTERSAYLKPDIVCKELQMRLEELKGDVDFITLAGSGEPTLNSNLPDLIQRIKSITTIPMAILTNSSLLSDRTIRDELLQLDLIVPSLDAVSQDVFSTINRPAEGLCAERIVEGLIALRKEFKGQIWMEVLFCEGINDSPKEIELLRKALSKINPERIQINTVFRPPAQAGTLPLSKEKMIEIKKIFGTNAQVVGLPSVGTLSIPQSRAFKVRLVELLKRRPCTIPDIINVLAVPRLQLIKVLDKMLDDGKLKICRHDEEIFYYVAKKE
ncbi:MAG: radical SAM protein [bacterium]